MVLCKCSLKIILTSLYLVEGLVWWDCPFTWCTDQMLSFSAWHCWLGHLTRKNRYNLYCVWWDVKPYSTTTTTPFPVHQQTLILLTMYSAYGPLIWDNTDNPCSHKGQTYWNNHWIFMSQMSFLSLNLHVYCQSTTGKPSGLVVLFYRHVISSPCLTNSKTLDKTLHYHHHHHHPSLFQTWKSIEK